MKKVISNYRDVLQGLMDVAAVPMGVQSRVDSVLLEIARAAGVQPADLNLCGEFSESGELVRTFVGVKDPRPDSTRELVEYAEVTSGEWRPPNRIEA